MSEDSAEVLSARRRVCDALHAMHRDQSIIVSLGIAMALEAAWDAYDEAVGKQAVERVGHDAAA